MQRTITLALSILGTIVALALSRAETSHQDKQAIAFSTPVRAFGAIEPRISPDGQSLAFSYHDSIWRMPRTGGTITRLTHSSNFDREPVWSPDGKRIAYANFHEPGAGELHLIDAETGQPVELPRRMFIRGTINYYKLYFHPDGQRLFGSFRADGMDVGLAWFDLNTGDLTPIYTPERWARFALSHDGKQIVVTPSMNVIGQQGGNDGPQADVLLISSDGGEPTKLLRFPSRIHDVCFSADDSSLYFVTELGSAHYDLWELSLAADDPMRSARKLTSGQADEHRPSVSNDGRWLAYSDNRERCTAIVVRDLKTGTETTLHANAADYRAPTTTIVLKSTDADTGKPVAARVSLEQVDGKHVYPVGALHRILTNYGHFYCNGEATLTVPAGTYRLRAFRGPEYKTTYKEFTVRANDSQTVPVEMTRWIHQAEQGWYSGENHIHANYGYGEWYNTPETMYEQCAGEDLNVCNFMVANSDTNGVFDREFFLGQLDPHSTEETLLYWNQEFRSTIWGHMTLVNLKQVVEPVFTGFKDTTNPWDIPTNSDIADRTHWQNGLVNYTHVAQNPEDPYENPYTGKSIPVDLALGKIDSIDLNKSYEGTVVLWHRLLNCGFRLPASAGTDCFLQRIRSNLPGSDRAYVKIDGPLTYQGWIEGLRAGRSFVTNGPMLELTVNGKGLGETIELPAGQKLKVAMKARSQFPMEKVELIINGKVVEQAVLTDKLSWSAESVLFLDSSCWIALRATGPGHPDHPLGSQYAHTSPVYIEVAGKPAGSREDAEYFLKWIDRLELAIRVRDRIPNQQLKRHVQEQFEAARAVYREIAER